MLGLANQQVSLLEPLVLVRLAQQPGDLDEPGLAQQFRETVRRPSVGERDLVVEFLRQRVVTGEESEQQVAARLQDSLELGEHGRQLLRSRVDDGVGREDAAEGTLPVPSSRRSALTLGGAIATGYSQ